MTDQPFQHAKSHRRTVCKKGLHALEGENLTLYKLPNGRYTRRTCRICANAKARAFYQKHKDRLKDRWRKYPRAKKKKEPVE